MAEAKEPDGVALIAAERERQVLVKRWSKRHDDDHGDHSLAAAACAYATPEPLYRLEHASQKVFRFVDCWPSSWDERYDHRERGPGGHLLDADNVPIDRRIRSLEKAGALIAAEIDRLLRLKKKQGPDAA